MRLAFTLTLFGTGILAAPLLVAQPPDDGPANRSRGVATTNLVERMMAFDADKDDRLTKSEVTDAQFETTVRPGGCRQGWDGHSGRTERSDGQGASVRAGRGRHAARIRWSRRRTRRIRWSRRRPGRIRWSRRTAAARSDPPADVPSAPVAHGRAGKGNRRAAKGSRCEAGEDPRRRAKAAAQTDE